MTVEPFACTAWTWKYASGREPVPESRYWRFLALIAVIVNLPGRPGAGQLYIRFTASMSEVDRSASPKTGGAPSTRSIVRRPDSLSREKPFASKCMIESKS